MERLPSGWIDLTSALIEVNIEYRNNSVKLVWCDISTCGVTKEEQIIQSGYWIVLSIGLSIVLSTEIE